MDGNSGSDYDADGAFKADGSPYLPEEVGALNERDHLNADNYSLAIDVAREATKQQSFRTNGPIPDPVPYRTITEARLAGKTTSAVGQRYHHDPEEHAAPRAEMRKKAVRAFPSIPSSVKISTAPNGHVRFSECMDDRFKKWETDYQAKNAKAQSANSQAQSAWY